MNDTEVLRARSRGELAVGVKRWATNFISMSGLAWRPWTRTRSAAPWYLCQGGRVNFRNTTALALPHGPLIIQEPGRAAICRPERDIRTAFQYFVCFLDLTGSLEWSPQGRTIMGPR